MKNIRLVLIGIIMGIANVIPGVSGGTIAIIFNIYDRLMECVTINIKKILANLDFLIPLGLGIVLGILGFSKLMEFLFIRFPQQTYFGFIGIIIGSLPLIYSKATNHFKKSVSLPSIFVFVLMVVLMVFLSFFNADKESGRVLFTSLDLVAFIYLYLSMTIATATMIIPGISGSMILIILGMYQTIYFEAINNINIPLLIPSVLGGISGLLLGAKLISYLLKKYSQITYMGILGLLVGSAYQLFYTSKIVALDLNFAFSCLVMVVSAIIIYVLSIGDIKEG